MSKQQDLPVVRDSQGLQVAGEMTVTQMIGQVIQRGDPAAVDMLERLVDLKLKVDAKEAERQFYEALAELQGEMDQVLKDGAGQGGTKYAPLESIDRMARPKMTKHGFSISYGEEAVEGTSRRYSARLGHRAGHSDTKYLTLPIDSGGQKNGVQAAGSTAKYAQRYLLCLHLNIVTAGEDTDGFPAAKLTEDQVRDIETMMKDAKVNVPAFMKWVATLCKVGSIELRDVPARHYKEITTAIADKMRRG